MKKKSDDKMGRNQNFKESSNSKDSHCSAPEICEIPDFMAWSRLQTAKRPFLDLNRLNGSFLSTFQGRFWSHLDSTILEVFCYPCHHLKKTEVWCIIWKGRLNSVAEDVYFFPHVNLFLITKLLLNLTARWNLWLAGPIWMIKKIGLPISSRVWFL